MAQTIQIRRSESTAITGITLAHGELAYTKNDNKLYIGEPGSGNALAIGGTAYTSLFPTTAGSVENSKLLQTGTSKNLTELTLGSVKISGTTIETLGAGDDVNLTITAKGAGAVTIDGLTYPAADGTNGQFLKTDGNGALSFGTVTSTFTVSDGTATDSFATGGTLTFTGGDGITTAVTDNTVTFAADLKTNGGIVVDSTKLAVDLSASAITGTLAVGDGGTGSTSAGDARTALGLAIGTNVQAYDAGLLSIAGLTTASNKMIYTTGSDTYAVTALTAAARGLLDDADQAAQRVTLGVDMADASGTDSAGSALVISGGKGTGTGVGGSIVFKVSPAGSSGDSANALTNGMTLDSTGKLTIEGDFEVKGTTTTVNSNTVALGDSILELNSDIGATDPGDTADGGIEINRGNYTNANFTWDESENFWTITEPTDTSDGTTASRVLTIANIDDVTFTLDAGTF
jgi:hypothetical protein